MSGRDAIKAAINDWLAKTPVAEVTDAATREESISGKILAGYSKDQVPLAVQLIGRQGLNELTAMNSTNQLDWTIDFVLRRHKRVGGVLWQHSEWFKSQLQQALNAFLVEVRARV